MWCSSVSPCMVSKPGVRYVGSALRQLSGGFSHQPVLQCSGLPVCTQRRAQTEWKQIQAAMNQVTPELPASFLDVEVGDTFSFLLSMSFLVFVRTFKDFFNARSNQLESLPTSSINLDFQCFPQVLKSSRPVSPPLSPLFNNRIILGFCFLTYLSGAPGITPMTQPIS